MWEADLTGSGSRCREEKGGRVEQWTELTTTDRMMMPRMCADIEVSAGNTAVSADFSCASEDDGAAVGGGREEGAGGRVKGSGEVRPGGSGGVRFGPAGDGLESIDKADTPVVCLFYCSVDAGEKL